ncbi:MAG: multidrug effflux MFS transporter [Pseudomonadota bacterium]
MTLNTTSLAEPVWLDRSTPPATVTLVVLAGLAALNMNIILPSLPRISEHYDADYALVQLAVSAYLATTAGLQLLIGPLSDRFGRRPVLIWSIAVFLVATLGCLLAPSFGVFLLFRLVQACVASAIVLSRAIVRDMFPPDQAASKIGLVTMGMAVAPMIGPMIGGVLDEWFGWHAVFAVSFVFGVVVLCLTLTDLGETNVTRAADFASQFRAMPELARSRRFWGYSATAAFASGSFFAFLGGGPYVSTTILGMTPSQLGLYFGLIALGYMGGNFVSARVTQRVGMNRMMLAGTLLTTMGVLLAVVFMSFSERIPLSFFGPMFFIGFGNGLTLPSATAGTVSVRPHLAGSASGIGGAMMIGGGAALSAISGALLGPETGPWPLLVIMLLSAILSVVCTLDVRQTAKLRGELPTNGASTSSASP